MATLTTAARNAACDAIVDLLDAGTTDAAGDIQFVQADTTTQVALCPFTATPAFDAAGSAGGNADGVASATGNITDDTNATGGITTIAKFRNRDNVEVFRATVGTGGTEIIFSDNDIGAGNTVSVTAMTVTMPDT